MTDIKSKTERSFNMSRIKGGNTKPEIVTRKYLHSKGLRFRLHKKELPGKPDIVLSKYRAVIFVNGCFWHAHKNCKDFVWPMTNQEFWKKKIESNVERDKNNYQLLNELGWRVIIVWECQITNKRDRELFLNGLVNEIIGLKEADRISK